jgi:glycosyltransferase involved in cell wall biosynthesis
MNEGLVKAVDRLIKKYDNLEIFTIGFFLPELKNRWKKHYFSMVGDRDVYSWAKNLWVKIMSMSDIAIAPLLVSNFTRCKSNIKYLECAAAKMPVVAQEIDQYHEIIKNGENGYLASTEQQWFDYLDALISDKELRKRIGEAGYQTIVDQHQIQNNYKKFQDYLLSVDKN